MRGRAVVVAVLALTTLSACDRPPTEGLLQEQVKTAMAELPYQYRLLPKRSTEDYATFIVVNPRQNLGVTFAYGLPAKGGGCSPFPQLPPHRKGDKPAVAAGPEPLICLEDDGWRRGDDYRESIVRGRIVGDVALALCEEVHDEWTCFV
jgi:hypothetical protein